MRLNSSLLGMADRSRTPSPDPTTYPQEKSSPQIEPAYIESGNQSMEYPSEPGDIQQDTSYSQLIDMDDVVDSQNDLQPPTGPKEPVGQTEVSDSAVTFKTSSIHSESTFSHRDDPAPTRDSQQHESASDGSSTLTPHLRSLENSNARQLAVPKPQHIDTHSEVSSPRNEQSLPLEVLQEKSESAETARHPTTGIPDAPSSLEVVLIVIGPVSDISDNTASASIPTEATGLNPPSGSRDPILLSATALAYQVKLKFPLLLMSTASRSKFLKGKLRWQRQAGNRLQVSQMHWPIQRLY